MPKSVDNIVWLPRIARRYAATCGLICQVSSGSIRVPVLATYDRFGRNAGLRCARQAAARAPAPACAVAPAALAPAPLAPTHAQVLRSFLRCRMTDR